MALFRNSNSVQLSLITNAFSRLRLQHAGSPVIPRHSTHSRAFTQTRTGLLKNATGVNAIRVDTGATTTTTVDRVLDSPKSTDHGTTPYQGIQLPVLQRPEGLGKKFRCLRKHEPRGARWTEEEDRELFRLAKEGKVVYEIYEHHFQHRSHAAVNQRVRYALKAVRLQQQQAARGVREGEGDVSKAAAGEEGATTLQAIYARLVKADAAQQEANRSDGDVRRAERLRRDLIPFQRGKWTPEEDALLEQLVHRFADIPQPTLWHKVSGGKVGDSVLVRSIQSCSHRWRQLRPPPSARSGKWTAEEDRLLQEAISEQLEGKYQVAVDVLVGKPPVSKEHNLAESQPHLQQLPSQAGLPILKLGSRRLRALSWVAVGEKVGSRIEEECRQHFYDMYHNAKRGPWSPEELRRAEEGLELFGNDVWKIAEHVGGRSPRQMYRIVNRLLKARKDRPAVLEATQEK